MRKNKLLLLLALLLTAATGAWAQGPWTSGACTVTFSDGVMTVSGTGAMADYKDSYELPWYSYCYDTKTIVIESGVTGIGNSAFAKCKPLESVSIPASVTNVGNYAFEECGSEATTAPTVSFAEGSTPLTIGEYAFNYANLKSIDIPNRVTSIGERAFNSCSNLESVSIPASVTSIGLEAFNNCEMLAKVYIYAPSLTTYGAMAFAGNATGRKIYVLSEAVDTYKAGWSDYAADIEAMTLYATSVKEGTEDADKWTISPNPAPEGSPVTIQYTGRLKVKGVKATSDEEPAEAPTITLDNTTTAWTAGKYAVPAGGLTYSDAITVSGDVTLVLTDGETLTLNKGISLASGATLTVEGNGTMNVNGTNESTTSTVAGSGTLVLTSGTLTATGGNGGNTDSNENDVHGGNGGVAINGSVIVSGGSLTARGGNGGSVDFQCSNCSGGNGGDAISGSVTVSGGTLTATGGNGGSVGEFGFDALGGNGGDAISGTLTKNGGSTSVNDGSNGSIGNMCDNCTAGTGGKATAAPAAKEPATVTTAPTGAAIVGVGKTTALVSGGAADGGELMYKVTTENTKPASTDGFSEAVPTAQGITASGTVYVWYYVKGDDTHTDSEIAATPIVVPVADIIWDATNISDLAADGYGTSYEKEGVTMSANGGMIQAMWYNYGDAAHDGIGFNTNESGGFTFTAPTGKAFTKIEMNALGKGGWETANLGTDWAYNAFNIDETNTIFTVTWKGSAAASTVELLTGADEFGGEPVNSIAFTLVDAE